MEKIKNKKYLEYVLIAFFIIQPIFDLKYFYNSISSLIRTIIVLVLFAIYFICSKNKKKYILIGYPILLTLYFIVHHINALNFKSVVPGNFNYSIIKEMLYFIKMLVPILLIYILYKSKISGKKVNTIINTLVIIIGLIIIITNLLGISYGSYTDTKITSNFISWFTNNNYTYKDLASKGLFEYANQISAILLMFLPFVIHNNIKINNVKSVLILLINLLALTMLGTRVAVLGTIIVFVYTILSIFFMKFIKKYKEYNIKKFISTTAICIMYVLILPSNPMFNRVHEMNNQIDVEIQPVINHNINNADLNDVSKIENNNYENENKDIKFIEENYKKKLIHDHFILSSYPYQYDTEFWLNIFNKDVYSRTNYRYLEKAMVKRVVEINNNYLDKLFGITNTRLQNIFNIEQDFIVHYYALGIIGTILVFLPYTVLILYYIYKAISSKFKKCTMDNVLAFITIFMTFAIAYNSGNLFNSLSFTIYFTILYYKLLYIEPRDEGGEKCF